MVKIDKKEVLRYLGHEGQDIDGDLNLLIDDVINKVEKSSYKYTYKKFPIDKNGNIQITDTDIEFEGKSIKNILKHSNEIIVFAATLGIDVDRKINSLKYSGMTEMMIWDACASEMIEKVVDKLEIEAKEEFKGFLAPRFSPGYGDLSLEYQKTIVKILEASKKIGLMVSDSLILMPKKSITGIIGLQENTLKVSYKQCDDCLYRGSCDMTKCKIGRM